MWVYKEGRCGWVQIASEKHVRKIQNETAIKKKKKAYVFPTAPQPHHRPPGPLQYLYHHLYYMDILLIGNFKRVGCHGRANGKQKEKKKRKKKRRTGRARR
jgi:hypothetical protein